MPRAGGSEGLQFLDYTQATRFQTRHPLPATVTDGTGHSWAVEAGAADADEQDFGLFDNGRLIAHLKLYAPEMMDDECPTGLWSIARIAVLDPYQGWGIGSGLIAAVCQALAVPLASDLDQTTAGAAIWKQLIRQQPGKVDLINAHGHKQPVQHLNGTYVPDPWKVRETRLIRYP